MYIEKEHEAVGLVDRVMQRTKILIWAFITCTHCLNTKPSKKMFSVKVPVNIIRATTHIQ